EMQRSLVGSERGIRDRSPADPTASEAPAEALHGLGELAATGPLAHPVALASTALLLTGAALTVVRRPWRRR
ncbi:hypothetical protein MTQ10_30580, partial [Streptomyces sp. XM83C]|uniref:hypothetical protein n=1 Tax=Streptomyces sp. XM83C TaxID=2929781 RepID=UPI001FFBE65D